MPRGVYEHKNGYKRPKHSKQMSGKGNPRYIDGKCLFRNRCVDCGQILSKNSRYLDIQRCRVCANNRENNPAYKNGIGFYREFAFEEYPKQCSTCGGENDLIVHHKDANRNNNAIENLQIICRRCHFYHHGLDKVLKRNGAK